jgi:hypothetical protein
MECPYANGEMTGRSIRCAALAGKKWDFCVHQYFCRDKGRYAMNKDAASCNLRLKKEVK